MREIKFRGKRKDNGEWVYGYLVDKDAISCGLGYVNEEKDDYLLVDCYLVIPETVGQYTGLRDKTDKEIYEGDIINGRWIEEDNDDYNYYENLIVRYDEEFGVFTVKEIPKPPYENYVNFLYQLRDIEVIGNIYENPELLKGE